MPLVTMKWNRVKRGKKKEKLRKFKHDFVRTQYYARLKNNQAAESISEKKISCVENLRDRKY